MLMSFKETITSCSCRRYMAVRSSAKDPENCKEHDKHCREDQLVHPYFCDIWSLLSNRSFRACGIGLLAQESKGVGICSKFYKRH
jgi:hypothetical protein